MEIPVVAGLMSISQSCRIYSCATLVMITTTDLIFLNKSQTAPSLSLMTRKCEVYPSLV
jgi:hypothetical protein